MPHPVTTRCGTCLGGCRGRRGELNTADAQTLTRELKGIGASKARAIVAYREEHGPFSSLDELLEVKGIGVSTLEQNRGKLSLQ